MVWGFEFGVDVLDLGVWILGFGVYVLSFGFDFGVLRFWHWVWGLCGLEIEVWGLSCEAHR